MSLKMMLVITMMSLLVQSHVSYAATYTVGDSGGWRVNVAGWVKGKNFKAGDILLFNYSPVHHNVVIVDKADYDSCTPPTPGSTAIYNSGHDHISLVKGGNYFISSYPGDCKNRMKIAANVA
ncbi:hypothetical protein ACS0TY_032676 [Phlomoides rotata]